MPRSSDRQAFSTCRHILKRRLEESCSTRQCSCREDVLASMPFDQIHLAHHGVIATPVVVDAHVILDQRLPALGQGLSEGLRVLGERPWCVYPVFARAEDDGTGEPNAVDAVGEGGVVCTGSEDDLIARIGKDGHNAWHVEADIPVRLGPCLWKERRSGVSWNPSGPFQPSRWESSMTARPP